MLGRVYTWLASRFSRLTKAQAASGFAKFIAEHSNLTYLLILTHLQFRWIYDAYRAIATI
jgi:hypothetical protein